MLSMNPRPLSACHRGFEYVLTAQIQLKYSQGTGPRSVASVRRSGLLKGRLQRLLLVRIYKKASMEHVQYSCQGGWFDPRPHHVPSLVPFFQKAMMVTGSEISLLLQNLGEAESVVSLYQYMRLRGYPAHKISILTTYNGQKALIRDVLERRCAPHPAFGRPRTVGSLSSLSHRFASSAHGQ